MNVGKYNKEFSVSMGSLEHSYNIRSQKNGPIECARRCLDAFTQLTGKSRESDFFPQKDEGWYSPEHM